MLAITVFKWGLSSSSMSSTPRTLIAPKALFKLSAGAIGKMEILRIIKGWHKEYECYKELGRT